MVNQNFRKFHKEQEKHKSAYISNQNAMNRGGLNTANDNSQEDTDISVGAVGRDTKLK